MECCTIHCALPSRKHSASRGRRLSRLSVSRSNRAPPSELIVPPSKRATISREPHSLNPKLNWVHSVIAKAAPFLALTASVETQLCQKERLFASLFCEKCGLGLVTSYTLGGYVHILLVVAVAILLIQLISGRRAV